MTNYDDMPEDDYDPKEDESAPIFPPNPWNEEGGSMTEPPACIVKVWAALLAEGVIPIPESNDD